ncbi:MAG TPA: hypothetical protein VI485_28735 [Vicinamibacterales bacterium]|nr:hypothetical protein [Vicinamibacterales bacterium]
MNLEQLIERMIPGGRAQLEQEERDAEQEKRQQLAKSHAEQEAQIAAKKRPLDPQIEKQRADEARTFEVFRASQQKRLDLEKRRNDLHWELMSARRTFEGAMRESAPRDLLQFFIERIERLLETATAIYEHATVKNGMGETRPITLSGDAVPRRKALFALRQQVLNSWHLQPLTDQEFEEQFATAVASLPAIALPPSVEEFIARQNGAAA